MVTPPYRAFVRPRSSKTGKAAHRCLSHGEGSGLGPLPASCRTPSSQLLSGGEGSGVGGLLSTDSTRPTCRTEGSQGGSPNPESPGIHPHWVPSSSPGKPGQPLCCVELRQAEGHRNPKSIHRSVLIDVLRHGKSRQTEKVNENPKRN